MDRSLLQQTILEDASLCVKCGLCLPHCPTYQITQDENESPRGRITLMQGLAADKLPLNAKLEKHLEQCLSCRHCERVCPASVPYGRLINHARAYIRERHAPFFGTTSFLSHAVLHPKVMTMMSYLFWLIEVSGIRGLGQALSIPKILGLKRLDNLLPVMQRPLNLKSFYPATTTKKGTVALFVGCMGRFADVDTLQAGLFALRQCGFDVYIPAAQGCCGAIAEHHGDEKNAEQLKIKNIHAFSEKSFDALIHMASGCGATLKEYGEDVIGKKITDISNFLIKHMPHELKPITAKVLLHTPCTLRNVCKEESAPYNLLHNIPGLNVISFSKISYCCGSAGTYMIEHPHMADELSLSIVEELEATKAHYLATSNIGCALHLNRLLKEKNSTAKVVHPIQLLARALGSL